MSNDSYTGQFDRPRDIPPLRQSPFTADDHDPARCAYIKGLWEGQDELLRTRDRQVEENIRMLHGQQWIVWSDMRGRFVNLAEHMGDDERRWRHMPVLNRLFLWYVLLHARMTENPPILSWQPGPDRIDALLAEVCDPIFKFIWRDVGMLEVLDRAIAWMIPSGRVYLKSRIDPMKGDPIPTTGPAMLQLMGGGGSPILGADGQPISRYVEDAPYAPGENGEYGPAAELVGDEEDPDGDYSVKPAEGVQPEALYEGGIEMDVLTCLEARGTWGEHVPWHRKSWHIQKSLLTPIEAWEALGVDLEPDVRGQEAEGTGTLWRLLHGSGLFGATDGRRSEPGSRDEFCTIYEACFRPGRMLGTERTEESPGGRLAIVTGGGQVIRDGVRIAPFKYTSPIHALDFVGLPGRPQGTSPQEFLNGPIRTRNRLHAQVLAHATLTANPIRVLDRAAGLEEGQVPNVPGAEVLVDRSRSKAAPIEYVSPPPLGSDVYEASDRLRVEVDQIGSISGTEATAPHKGASGELVEQLRFNSDRPIAATMRSMVSTIGRIAEDWLVLAPIVWDREKIISVAGEDGIDRTITVYPDLFRASVNVEPEVESMLPEGRAERQKRMQEFWQLGVWGPPDSPAATNIFLDLARFPHMSRATRPGGADRATAGQNVGKLLKGTPAAEIPVFPWYDHLLFQFVTEQFMKSPEYLKVDPAVQQEFVTYWMMLLEAGAQAAVMQGARATAVEAEATRGQLSAQADLKPLADAAAPADLKKPAA